jgi:hypothetical protein
MAKSTTKVLPIPQAVANGLILAKRAEGVTSTVLRATVATAIGWKKYLTILGAKQTPPLKVDAKFDVPTMTTTYRMLPMRRAAVATKVTTAKKSAPVKKAPAKKAAAKKASR